MWQLVVETAVQWARTDIEDLIEFDQTEGRRLEVNLQMFQTHIADYWAGSPNTENPMQEFHRLENLQYARKGISDTAAHEHGTGVSFSFGFL
jgi:hypothetical protein